MLLYHSVTGEGHLTLLRIVPDVITVKDRIYTARQAKADAKAEGEAAKLQAKAKADFAELKANASAEFLMHKAQAETDVAHQLWDGALEAAVGVVNTAGQFRAQATTSSRSSPLTEPSSPPEDPALRTVLAHTPVGTGSALSLSPEESAPPASPPATQTEVEQAQTQTQPPEEPAEQPQTAPAPDEEPTDAEPPLVSAGPQLEADVAKDGQHDDDEEEAEQDDDEDAEHVAEDGQHDGEDGQPYM